LASEIKKKKMQRSKEKEEERNMGLVAVYE